MTFLFRTLQLAVLLACIPSLQSFIIQPAKVLQPLTHRNALGNLLRRYVSFTDYGGTDMSHLEQIEFYLYSDSIDYKLIQSDFIRGTFPRKGSIMDSDQVDSKALQIMLMKESESAVRSASL